MVRAGVGTVGAEVGAVAGVGGVGSRMGEDGGVLRKVDGKRLDTVDTVDTVESDGDDGREDGVRDGVVGAVRGTNRPDLSRRSEEARLSSVGVSSSDGGQR
jgi:hypothetical protein